MPSPGRLGAALAIPVAGILQVIGRDLYGGYRGRLKTEPAIGQEEVPMSSLDAPDRADGMAGTVDTPGGPVVRDRRYPTNSVAIATAVSPASSMVTGNRRSFRWLGIVASPARPSRSMESVSPIQTVDGLSRRPHDD